MLLVERTCQHGPKKTEQLDLGGVGWRDGTNVYVIANGGTEANRETASTRAKFAGTVVVPEDTEADPYIRWDPIAATDDDATQWKPLVEANGAPTLVSGAIYKDYVGATFTAYAINRSLPGWGTWMTLIAAWLFAISTMISWSYYGEQGIVYLLGKLGCAVLQNHLLRTDRRLDDRYRHDDEGTWQPDRSGNWHHAVGEYSHHAGIRRDGHEGLARLLPAPQKR